MRTCKCKGECKCKGDTPVIKDTPVVIRLRQTIKELHRALNWFKERRSWTCTDSALAVVTTWLREKETDCIREIAKAEGQLRDMEAHLMYAEEGKCTMGPHACTECSAGFTYCPYCGKRR